jgi:hypothetical protein
MLHRKGEKYVICHGHYVAESTMITNKKSINQSNQSNQSTFFSAPSQGGEKLAELTEDLKAKANKI